MRRSHDLAYLTVLITLILVWIPTFASAQEGSPVIRIQSEVVLVDLLAFDESGEFVPDLRKEDIEIWEDGKSREISFFELADFSDSNRFRTDKISQQAATDSSRDLRRPNPFILVIDLNNFEGGDLHFAQESIQTFFSQHKPNESDLFMLFAIQDQLVLLNDLTNDPEEILKTVNSLRGSATSLNYKSLVEKIGNTFRILVPAGFSEQAMEQSITDAKLFRMDVRDRVSSTTNALRDLAEYLEPIPGRKNVLFASRGYPTNSGSIVYEIISAFNRGIYAPTLMSAKLGPSSDDQTMSDLRKCSRALNGSQIAVYCLDVKGVDPTGLANSPDATYIPQTLKNRFNTEDQISSQTFFDRVSETTTGLVFKRSNFQEGFSRVIEEGTRYYLTGFQSKKKKKEGQYTNLEVTIKRPGTQIRFREGFVHREIDDLEDLVIRTAFQFPRFYQEFPLQTDVKSVSGRDVTVTFNLPTSAIQFEKRGDKSSCIISVYGILVDKDGNLTTKGNKYTFAKEFPLNLDRVTVKNLRTVGAPIQFDADPGDYQLVVVVRQLPSGIFGTSTNEITIQ